MPPTAPWWKGATAGLAILIVNSYSEVWDRTLYAEPTLSAQDVSFCFHLQATDDKLCIWRCDRATPLAQLKAGNTVNTMDMLIGRIPGTIGETSVIAIDHRSNLWISWENDLRIPEYTLLHCDLSESSDILQIRCRVLLIHTMQHFRGGGLMLVHGPRQPIM